jgi:membrane fusion protein, multidrug efflux system
MTENIQNKEQVKVDEHKHTPLPVETVVDKIKKDKKMLISIFVLVFAVLFGALAYLYVASKTIEIDKSQVLAPSIDISTSNGGALDEVYVRNGDTVPANTVLARLGAELIKTKESAQVINVRNNIGKIFAKGETVVTVINPDDLRVVGSIEEDKGFSDIRLGQRVTFTVDTFGSKKYEGVVDEIAPSVHSGDVVFNISDKREIQKFDVKVRFPIAKYPELRNGMSAKITIYK